MKIASSLKSLKKRDLNSKLVKRRGRVYIINKKNPKFKARQKQAMIIGTVSENKELEKRISITPEIAKKYISNGFEVMIEKDLASHLGITDKEFLDEGCKVESRENVLDQSNIILQLNLRDEKSTNLLKENKILIGNFNFVTKDPKIKYDTM